MIAPAGKRAYVAVTNQDKVGVLDTTTLKVERFLSVAVKAGVGASPNGLAVTPNGKRLLVSDAGTDAVTVFTIGKTFKLAGRVPTAHYPTAVAATAKLIWLTGKGLGTGPNPGGPNPFNSATLDQSGAASQFLPRITLGSTGIGAMPTDKQLKALTKQADAQVKPANLPASAPADTPIKPGGPIKHVFFIVRENRTYDQMLGDVSAGAGDPSLALFKDVTPNLHAGHAVPAPRPSLRELRGLPAGPPVDGGGRPVGLHREELEPDLEPVRQVRRPRPAAGGRGVRGELPAEGLPVRPGDPPGDLLLQLRRAAGGNFPLPYPQLAILANTTDFDRTPADQAADHKFNHSDLGPSVGGCFPQRVLPRDRHPHQQADLRQQPAAGRRRRRRVALRLLQVEVRAAGRRRHGAGVHLHHAAGRPHPGPVGRPADAAGLRRRQRLRHRPGHRRISHSSLWASSAVFVVEDDSQDGADHVDAHRIPAIVASPYAKSGTISTRYDQLSVLRTMELILGMNPLSLNDGLATPMYDAFQATPGNLTPYDAIVPAQSRTERNPGTAKRGVIPIPLDSITQRSLDAQLWRSVHGTRSVPPPPGPNAVAEGGGGSPPRRLGLAVA